MCANSTGAEIAVSRTPITRSRPPTAPKRRAVRVTLLHVEWFHNFTYG